MWLHLGLWACGWLLLLEGTTAVAAPRLLRALGRSDVAADDRDCAIGQLVSATVKSVLVSGSANLAYANASRPLIELGLCVDPWLERAVPFIVARFAAYEIADLCFMLRRPFLLSKSTLAHHCIHIAMACIYLSGGTALTRTGLLLTMQETSGVVLNPYLLVRSRLSSTVTNALFLAFAVLFLAYRIVGGAVALWWALACADAEPRAPRGSTTLCVMGYLMQLWWAGVIASKVLAKMRVG